ncbi:MAG: NADP-dependent oxidoreductase [Aeromicrobium sp.]|jgi:NADPH-dependent curcumin reductase CurA|uniref:NADP-dependent oxidoreductase n=1 Tax=Aeromicrobium sp. TaxID=1871063 RepID=UPI002615D989|nr:NADP-dependent oxidoreductase [Aeromicrobium sp.]MCW2789210.1 NADP-dependent oxidoreductase [Aeromicrobium sp.]MCW2826305.1 NADP-dependent oxidoreductase [Aeromicrobium sp.]
MSTPDHNTRILLDSRPHGEPTPDNFRFETVPVPAPAEGEVLLRTIYLSLDPYMRGRMNDAKSYAAPVELGAVMEGGTVCEVVESRDPGLAPGDIVLAHGGWQEYAVAPARQVRRLDPARAPISTAVGVLGMPGFTAYAGLLEIGRPQPGETVVVAAAAGPVGSTVGQIARIKGARAVGIAGGADKVAWLEELGFDVALDHRSPTFRDDLEAAVPDGIDVYFENVGGHVWDAVLPRLNTYARVPVCGLVSHYNETELPAGPDRSSRLMTAILTRSLTVRGFIQNEFVSSHYKAFQADAAGWIADGSLRYKEDIVAGLDNAPDAFLGMLKGQNFGKLVVQVGADPTS